MTHEEHVLRHWPNGVEGVDYVECRLCYYAGVKITQHVKAAHGIERDEYIEAYGPVQAEVTRQRYREVGRQNGNWIGRANERGDDLTEYKRYMGERVRESIMSNDAERKRRSDLAKRVLATWAQSEEGRRSSSETAKRTSSRPDIRETRGIALVQTRKGSQFENAVLEALRALFPNVTWKRNHILTSNDRRRFVSISGRRQIDIIGSNGVMIEVDGHQHFNETMFSAKGDHPLYSSSVKDNEIDDYVTVNGLTLIRIAYDQYSYRKRELSQECKNELIRLMMDIRPGIHRIGDAYVKA